MYWRKLCLTAELFPDREHDREARYVEGELWYVMRDLVTLLRAQGKLVLVEPFAEERVGKLVQMQVAADYFAVPPWKFVLGTAGPALPSGETVAKSLTLGRVRAGAVIYTSRVREQDLDPSVPWLLQAHVEAEQDVTVVYVRGAIFAFESARAGLPAGTVDWRERDPSALRWTPHALPPALAAAIRRYMDRLALAYGRLDFLRRRGGDYVFLEVNPNGEWGWLDPRGEHGVLARIIEEVAPWTPTHPIPASPDLPPPGPASAPPPAGAS